VGVQVGVGVKVGVSVRVGVDVQVGVGVGRVIAARAIRRTHQLPPARIRKISVAPSKADRQGTGGSGSGSGISEGRVRSAPQRQQVRDRRETGIPH